MDNNSWLMGWLLNKKQMEESLVLELAIGLIEGAMRIKDCANP